MNKIDKFRGLLEIEVKDEKIILNSLKVNDLFDLLLFSKVKDDQFLYGFRLMDKILRKSLEDEDLIGLEGYIISNYTDLLDAFVIALGWSTKEKLEKLRKEQSMPKKKVDSKLGAAMFKAKLNSEVDSEEIEDKYITACYVLMREFKYTRDEILNMDASVFLILLDEMNKQAEKEKEAMESKNKTFKKH